MDALRRKLLLVVDDESRSAQVLAKMLREDGFEVELAFDGATAIGRLTRSPLPDALVTDLRMPHVDGVAVAKYARSRRPDLPVVFITGYPQLVGDSVAELAPEPVLHTKPVEYRALRQELAKLLGMRRSTLFSGGVLTTSEHAREIESEHEQLPVLLSELGAVGPGSDRQRILARLQSYLDAHFKREEAPEGFFAELLRLAPRFQPRVHALRQEHGQLRSRLESTLEQGAADADAGQAAVEELRRRIEAHEAEERRLLESALEWDPDEQEHTSHGR